ncbi:type II toxin-antitoxin system RelE/ParE family toxin [Thiobacillus sp.]|uniref:type II toxin-antitoxin system RelE/ParE family toxin n=1 Tax=Thiobacillus sp. TaxID=924 RepID=UPI00286E4E4A|nr:type II toxin-antitoxin system RelE/ParE family toxin [Thiobacillus sp.]
MSRSLVFRRQAREEFDAAGDWYERERPGLGRAFLTEVERVLQTVVSNPDTFPEVLEGIRKAVIKRFPYCLYFRVRGEVVVVPAVFHSARNPAAWRTRK